MDAEKRRLIEAKGYAVGNVAEVLQLSPAEAAEVEVRLTRDRIAGAVRRLRIGLGLSQAEAGRRAGLTQQQVGKIEKEPGRSGPGGAGADLMLRLLFALGGTLADLTGGPEAAVEAVVATPAKATAARSRATTGPAVERLRVLPKLRRGS